MGNMSFYLWDYSSFHLLAMMPDITMGCTKELLPAKLNNYL
jgi:hypothetical protein